MPVSRPLAEDIVRFEQVDELLDLKSTVKIESSV